MMRKEYWLNHARVTSNQGATRWDEWLWLLSKKKLLIWLAWRRLFVY